MERIDNWDEIKATGDYTYLPGNGYVMVVRKATAKINQNNKPYIEILCDVAEGDYKGFAGDNEKAMRRMNAYYKEKSAGLFKRFIESIEQSNARFKWNWDENALVGKIFGVVLFEEEYLKDGELRVATKMDYTTTTAADKIRKGDFKPIKKKTLNPSAIEDTDLGTVVNDVECPF